MVPPKSSNSNRVFHDKPSILGYHHFLETSIYRCLWYTFLVLKVLCNRVCCVHVHTLVFVWVVTVLLLQTTHPNQKDLVVMFLILQGTTFLPFLSTKDHKHLVISNKTIQQFSPFGTHQRGKGRGVPVAARSLAAMKTSPLKIWILGATKAMGGLAEKPWMGMMRFGMKPCLDTVEVSFKNFWRIGRSMISYPQ